jgi:16S rRNA (guanine527-N7)-methyltransferase
LTACTHRAESASSVTGLLENGIRILIEKNIDILEPRLPCHDSVWGARVFYERTALLKRFCDEIESFNPMYNLVAVKDGAELVVRHILDSLAPIGLISRCIAECGTENPRIADVGSGAGLPGMPLAILLPQVSFSLIERMGRRAGFLRNTAAVLALRNVEVLEKAMENAQPAMFDVVCFRAFRPLTPEILQSLLRLLKPRSYLAAYKGRVEAINAEMRPLSAMLARQNIEWRVIPCETPFLDAERHLVLIKKP